MPKTIRQDSLDFHAGDKPGKLEITVTKPLQTQRDLALAYSPGVANPVLEIVKDPKLVYRYTNKGNMVAVISNGTAVLGLGDTGALASKPVMEGKCVLFKRFAGIDSIDLEIDTTNVDAFVNCVRYLGPAFSGINLEDIKAPESMIIEERLSELMDIPVFHDDQHGTAVVVAAALVNALKLTGKSMRGIKFVCAGAGSAALSVVTLLKSMGLPAESVIMCDEHGVLGPKRKDLDSWCARHRTASTVETLREAMVGADVALGLSRAGVFTVEMIADMAKDPIIFAMANPEPEIHPSDVKAVRNDAIMATGRSDYPNQVNNVLCFPYIFRGAIDVRASRITEHMKITCAMALAKLAREPVPESVCEIYGRRLDFGPDYIIPTPFDPRLLARISKAVSDAARESGVARV